MLFCGLPHYVNMCLANRRKRRAKMKIGDLILCAGNSRMSDGIRAYQRVFCRDVCDDAHRLSHVAAVGLSKLPTIYETTTYNQWCDKCGAQENLAQDFLDNYDGDVWLREIERPLSAREFLRYRRAVCASRDLPYENGIPGTLELLLAGIEWDWFAPIARKFQTKTPHCSERVANVMKATKMLPADTRTNKLPPCEWWGDGKVDELLMVCGIKFGKPIKYNRLTGTFA